MVMLIGGSGWIVFISLFNVLILNLTPDWVRARVLAVLMLVVQGGVAAGSAAWGALAGRFGIHNALLWAGIGTGATAVLVMFLRLPGVTFDLTPWVHCPLPRMVNRDPAAEPGDRGPIPGTVGYDVLAHETPGLLDA